QDTKVGAPPPCVDVTVRPGDAGANERKEIVNFLLLEILVERLQHAVLYEEAKLERVNGHAVRRATGACLLQQASMLAADVGGEKLEVDLPVGMLLGPGLPHFRERGLLLGA